MYSASPGSANAYQTIGVHTSVTTSDPHQLIVLLLSGARQAILIARGGIEQNNVAVKGGAITKAIDIILNGLRASLDMEKGGEIAANLGALYDYMSRRLLHANVHNDLTALEEVLKLLTEIQEAWEAIANHPAVKGNNK